MRRRSLLAASATAGAAAAAGGLPGRALAQPAGAAVVAPPLVDWPDIGMLDGSTRPAAFWQGQAAVVVFWATWCPFCRRHNAHVDKLQQAVRGRPLQVLGVSMDTDADAVRRYMTSNRYTFAVALDGGRLRQRFTPRRVVPTTCVVDRQGRLVQTLPGEMAEDDVLGVARMLQRPAT